MLDWDKPLKTYSKQLQKQLNEIAQEEGLPINYQKSLLAENRTGQDFYDAMTVKLGSPDKASAILNSYGIKGIKYADEGSRNWRILPPDESVSGKWTVGKWPGGGKETKYFDNEKDAKEYLKQNYTSNFVVFDPKEVKILEKNSKPVSRKDIIEEQVNNLK